MKSAAFAIAAITVSVAAFGAGAASAAATDRATDVDFLRANRCKGLATAIGGVVDPASLDGYIKAERTVRAPYIMERAAQEFDKARREGRSADRRERLTAELNGPCQAYLPGQSATTKQ